MNYTDLPPGRSRRLMYSRNTYNIKPTFIVSRPNIINNQILTDKYIKDIIQQHQIQQQKQQILQQKQQILQQKQQILQQKQQILQQRQDILQQRQDILQQREHIQNLQDTLDIQNRRIENLQIEERLDEIENIHHTVQLINNKLIEKSQVCLNLFDDNFCVICQDDISNNVGTSNSIIRVLKCTHCFHINCIDKWFTINNFCPTCKFELL